MSNETIKNVIENCIYELIDGKYILSKKEMLNKYSLLSEARRLMLKLLDYLESRVEY
jgi:hypothetical protein